VNMTTNSNAGIAAVRLLEAVNASADVFPPLKNASGRALRLWQLIEGFYVHKKHWIHFVEHVQRSVALFAQSVANPSWTTGPLSTDRTVEYVHSLENLNKLLVEIRNKITILRGSGPGRLKQILTFLKAPRKIEEMEKDLNRVLANISVHFTLDTELLIGQDVSTILNKTSSSYNNTAIVLLKDMELALDGAGFRNIFDVVFVALKGIHVCGRAEHLFSLD